MTMSWMMIVKCIKLLMTDELDKVSKLGYTIESDTDEWR